MNGSVLIVEDDAIIAHDLSLILTKHEYQVVKVCHKATQAIDQLAKGGIDIAILDIHLGTGQSGIDVAQVIKGHYSIPYIFLTSFSDSLTLQAAKEQGPYGYLVKPFHEATLLTTLSIAMSNHREQNKKFDFDKIPQLTDQESSICEYLYKGLSYQEVADQLLSLIHI